MVDNIRRILKRKYSRTTELEVALQAIFSNVETSDTAEETDAVYLLIQDCFDVLTYEQNIAYTNAQSALTILSSQIDTLCTNSLVQLTNFYVKLVKKCEEINPHIFSLLAQVINAVSDASLDNAEFENMDTESLDKTENTQLEGNMSKSILDDEDCNISVVKSQTINTLCSLQWHPCIILPITKALIESQITLQQFRFLTEKSTRCLCHDEEPQNCPPIIKELLNGITSRKVPALLVSVDEMITKLEICCTSESKKTDFHEAIGMMFFDLSRNNFLSNDILKYLRISNSGEYNLSFSEVGILICLLSIRKHQQIVNETIFSLVVKGFKDEEKMSHSKLMRDFTANASKDNFTITLTTLAKSTTKWDITLLIGFVKFAISLIQFSNQKLKENILDTDPTKQTANTGASILQQLFTLHKSLREHILSNSLEQIVTHSQMYCKMPYLDLLKSIISSSPQIVVDSSTRMIDAIEYVPNLPLTTAYTFLDAIQPLIKFSLKLRDSLMLTMRKALFMKNTTSRCIGVYGFILVIKKFKINFDGMLTLCSQRPTSQPFSSSQILVEIRDKPTESPEANEGLCLEVLGILNRCLTQSAEVREVLYNGAYDVMCVNPRLDTPILEMLLNNVRSYIPRENRVGELNQPAVFKLDSLFEFSGIDFVAMEKLPSLLASLQLCYKRALSRLHGDIETLESDDILRQTKLTLDTLMNKLISASIEDFELGVNSDFTGVGIGRKNLFIARSMIGIYECFIEYAFMQDEEISSAHTEMVMLLFSKCERILALIRDKMMPQRRSAPAPKETEETSFTFPNLVYILTSILTDNNPAHEVALLDIRENIPLVKHVFNSAILRLQELANTGYILDSPWLYHNKTFKKVCQFGRVFIRHLHTPIVTSKFGPWKRDRGKTLDQYSFEALLLIFKYVEKYAMESRIQFLTSLRPDLTTAQCSSNSNNSSSNSNNNSSNSNIDQLPHICYLHIQGFQQILVKVITDQQDRFNIRDMQPLTQILNTLHSWLPVNSSEILQAYDWELKLCSSHRISDLISSKIVDSLFAIHLQLKTSLSIFRKFAEDIHLVLGDIDQETEIDDELHFQIITMRNVTPSITLILLAYLDRILEETDWLIAKMYKSHGKTSHEELMANRLLTLVATFHHLIQTNFPLGSVVDKLPVLCTKLYNTFLKAVKYFLSLYSQGAGYIPEKFEQVIVVTGTHLEEQMYNFISHFQALTAENFSGNYKEKNKKEKDKNKESDFKKPVPKAKIMKETRSYPNLIFAIEQYENYLIQLSKKSKKNLLENFKTSTTRDFRINAAIVDATINETVACLGENEVSRLQLDDEVYENPEKRFCTQGAQSSLDILEQPDHIVNTINHLSTIID